MVPPAAFVKKLRAYDPDLRVRWSPTKECWLLERRVRRARTWYGGESPDPDVKRRYLDGYVHVGSVAPRGLNELVLLHLWHNDMWTQGGATAVNAALDDYWETKERADARTQRDDLKAIAGDIWDHLAWRRRSKIVVGGSSHGTPDTTRTTA